VNGVYSWVKNIIIFLVLSTIINNLLGKSTYKKYINLITGIILVILVISPLFKVFELDKSLEYYMSTNFFVAESENINQVLLDSEQEKQKKIFQKWNLLRLIKLRLEMRRKTAGQKKGTTYLLKKLM